MICSSFELKVGGGRLEVGGNGVRGEARVSDTRRRSRYDKEVGEGKEGRKRQDHRGKKPSSAFTP